MKNSIKNKKSGFTLIELIISIGIVAVLFGIIAPNFNSYRKRADYTKIKTEVMNVYLAAETIANSYDTKSETENALKIDSNGINNELTRYTSISKFDRYTIVIDNDGYLDYIEYDNPEIDSGEGNYFRFYGDADIFMEEGNFTDR